ncbi:MAG: ROK family protein [Planctomycetes bacterium]|nr:ROK family protein [Planctomycetota bacterium]
MILIGMLETGGTTVRVALGEAGNADNAAAEDAVADFEVVKIVERAIHPTTHPAETLARAAEFFRGKPIVSLGIAAFGPLELRPGARDYGSLLATPKPGWSHFPLRHALAHALQVPVAIDTDVSAAALAEQHVLRAHGTPLPTLAYVTVGTGIGVGLAFNRLIYHGALHPEAGHLRVARAEGDEFVGLCPFHRDCLEGLASAPALAARAGGEPSTLRSDSPALRTALAFEADYLAQLVLTLVGIVAPHRIVLGGGVLQNGGLLDAVRARAVELASGYSPLLADRELAEALIVPPVCGGDSGLVGAALLALRMIVRSKR